MAKTGVAMIVHGMVQGVGFRYYVRSKAHPLGVCGFVRNLPDGTVEVRAEGPRGMLEELIKEVKAGPSYSSVRDVTLQWYEATGHYKSFEIAY
jgi:acylphosphatase